MLPKRMVSSIQVLGRAREQAPPVVSRAAERWVALDVFRVSAVLLMIQGHTFTALLEPAAYQGAWVRWYRLTHGLTAPMFLFGAGLAYGIVTFGSRVSTTDADAARARTRIFRRACALIAIGTALQWLRVSLHALWSDRTVPVRLARGRTAAARWRMLARVRRDALVAPDRAWARDRVAELGRDQRGDRADGLERCAAPSSSVLGGWLDGRGRSQFPSSRGPPSSCWPRRAPSRVAGSSARGEPQRLWQPPWQRRGGWPAGSVSWVSGRPPSATRSSSGALSWRCSTARTTSGTPTPCS